MGPYIARFLQFWVGWGPAQIGTALAVGNLAQVIAQTPAGAMIDKLRQKRALLSVGIVMIAAVCLATVWLTSLPVVTAAQVLTAQGCGVFLSNCIGGVVAKHMGNDFTFCLLGGIAAVGFMFFLLLMPETKDKAKDGCGADEARNVGGARPCS